MKINIFFIPIFLIFILASKSDSNDFGWNPQPAKAGLMLIFAHPDDEGITFGGAIPYYAVVKKIPTIAICMTTTAWIPQRKDEMRCAIWNYGMRNAPIFADFPDCCYGTSINYNWKEWGGREKVVAQLTALIRKYKPDVILTHALDGEYGHPNHILTALATEEAVFAAKDKNQFPSQLDSLETWEVKKLYMHEFPNYENITYHSWDMKCPELGGKTPAEVANQAMKCHASQDSAEVKVSPDSDKWGLYYTSVGYDSVARDDFFEHIKTDY